MSSANDLTAAGWISYQSHSGSFLAIETTASNVHSGSKALNIDSWSAGSTSDYVIVGLPVLAEPINTLQLGFSYKVSTGNVYVGYLTDANDASTFVSLQSYNASSSYTTIEDINLSTVPSTAARIAIKYLNWYRCYIDDINVSLLPSCVKPSNFSAGNTTKNSVVLSWTAGGSETEWSIFYKKATETVYAQETANSNPFTLNGLESQTEYEVFLKANCSATDQSDASAIVSFSTDCEPNTTYPWSENFDGLTVADEYTAPSERVLPVCWKAINTTSYNSYKPFPTAYYYSYTNYANSTPNCLKLYSYYYNSSYTDYDPQPQYAILPEMSNLAGKQITLQARGYNTSSTFKIGTMSDPNDVSTFELITEQTGLTTSYQEFIYNIPATATTATNVVIMIEPANSSRTYNGVYVDDIVIANPPSCLKPTALACTAVTTSTATLSWTNGANESAWQICVNGDEENLVAANSNPFTVPGLDAATVYTFKVRAYCSASDQSDWSNEISVTTECDVVSTFPSWNESFNTLTAGIPVCWDNSDGTTTTDSYKWNYYATGHDGVGLRFNSYSNASGNTNFLKTPELSLPAGKNMQLGFWYKNPKGGDFSVYISTDGGNTYTTELATGLTGQSAWEEKIISLADYTGQSVVIVFKGTSNYGNGDAYIYLDDVTINEAPSCPKPTGLSASEITKHSAELSWTEKGDASAWKVAYKVDDESVTEFTEVDVTANPYTLDGLEAETDYVVKVRANCGSGSLSDYSAEISVSTPIACIAPLLTNTGITNITAHSADVAWAGDPDAVGFTVSYRTAAYMNGLDEGFEDATEFTQWQAYGVVSTNTGYRFGRLTDAKRTGNYGFAFSSYSIADDYNQYLISPKINVGGTLKFYYRASSTSGTETFKVGYSSTGNDASDFTWGDEISTNSTSWIEFSETVPAGTKYIAIHYYSNYQYDLYIDDITLGEPIPAGDWVEVAATASPKTITGLAAETKYEVKVKGNCGDDGYSAESSIRSFTTSIACPTPSALAASEVGPNSIKLNWIEKGEASAWIIAYKDTADATADYQEVPADSNPFTLTNLNPLKYYAIKVKADCGTLDGNSEWTDTIIVKTSQTCPIPADLVVSNISADSADIAWADFNDSYSLILGSEGAANVLLNEDFSAGSIPSTFVNTSADPWTIVAYEDGYCIKSSNAGVASSTSEISVTIDFATAGIIEFDAECKGEGTSSYYDHCDFYIDETRELYAGANISGWKHYAYAVSAGQHTFKWSYTKDSSVNPTGDYFAVANIFAFESGSIVWADAIAINEAEYTLNDLEPDTKYFVKVKGFCTSGSVETEWSDSIVFTTHPSITIQAPGYATYYNADMAYKMPVGLVGYAFSTENSPKLQEAYSSNAVVPAGMPLVLKTNEIISTAQTFELVPATGGSALPTSIKNQLKGVNRAKTAIENVAGNKYYILSLDAAPNDVPESIGFYFYYEGGVGGFPMPAHKAFLKVPVGPDPNAAPSAFLLIDDENNATWIENLEGVEGTVKFLHEGKIFILREGVIYDATGRKVREL